MAKATREAFGEAIVALAEKFPQLVVLDSDLSKSTMTADFAQEVSEEALRVRHRRANMVGAAAGMALWARSRCARASPAS